MNSDVVHTTEQPSSAPAFTYDHFDHAPTEIRLVEILECTEESLKLKLSKYKKADAPNFHAISYTWSDGGVPQLVEITVNGQVMYVTENCRYALKQAHSHQSCQALFWIDSICIDQKNALEKQHQVEMMADIYAQADKVLSCVGCHQDNSEDLAKVLKAARFFAMTRLKHGNFPHSAENEWFDVDDDTTRRAVKRFVLYYEYEYHSRVPTIWESFLQTFVDFSARRYWTRLWIVQEVAASKQLEVLCGSNKFSRSDIYLLQWIVTSYWYSFVSEGARWDPLQAQFYRRERSRQKDGESLYTFLKFVLRLHSEFRIPAEDIFSVRSGLGCSRPEDRVYGILRFVKWPTVNPPIIVEPVYKPSATVDLAEILLSIRNSYNDSAFEGIFKGLEIYHNLAEVERLVAQRSVYPSAPERQPGKYPPRLYYVGFESYGVLFKSKFNNYGLNVELDRIETAPDELFLSPKLVKSVQLLWTGSEIAGVLCISARKDDLIIQTPFRSVLLVLRSTGNLHEYAIIGQGLLLSGFELPRKWPLYSAWAETHGRRAKKRIEDFLRYTLHTADSPTENLEAYEQNTESCRRYLESLSQKILKERYSRTEPPLNVMTTKMILSWADPDKQHDCWFPDQDTQRALDVIGSLLHSVSDIQEMEEQNSSSHAWGTGWRQHVSWKLEPIEMLLMACQDREKNGSRNKDRMMQRLTTKVHGTVVGG